MKSLFITGGGDRAPGRRGLDRLDHGRRRFSDRLIQRRPAPQQPVVCPRVDDEVHTRDLRRLGGLRRWMPIPAAVALIAGLSMAGLPPLFGFLAKETLLAMVTHPAVPAALSLLFPAAAVPPVHSCSRRPACSSGIRSSGARVTRPSAPTRRREGHVLILLLILGAPTTSHTLASAAWRVGIKRRRLIRDARHSEHEQDRAQVAASAEQIQKVTGESVEVAFVDQGYTGTQPAADAEQHGIRLEVVKLPTAKRGFVLLPRPGSSSAASAGWHVSGAWPRETGY